MALNDECKHNISDDDCYKCFKQGIIFSCPVACEHFEDIMSEKQRGCYGDE